MLTDKHKRILGGGPIRLFRKTAVLDTQYANQGPSQRSVSARLMPLRTA
jgi:hypothetical protein